MIWLAPAVLTLVAATAYLVAVLHRLSGEVRQLRGRVSHLEGSRRVNWPDPPVLLRDVMNQDR